jgi:hypothetical protein
MIEPMAALRITEAELARDVHAVLAKVREGVEVIVERDTVPWRRSNRRKDRGPQDQRVRRRGESA